MQTTVIAVWLLYSLITVRKVAHSITFNDGTFGVSLELIKHQPCGYVHGASSWNRILEFEGGDDRNGPKLVSEPGYHNCYIIGGKVKVFSEFKGDFSIYIEMRNTVSQKKVPESCVNQHADGCGGFGSCLYCNACEAIDSTLGVQAQLLVNGQKLRCGDTLLPGTYNNIALSFCLPPVDAILRSQGISRDAFMSLLQSEDGRALRGFGVFLTIYVFNTDASKKMQMQRRIESVYRKNRRSLFKDDPLPPEIYWSLPFNEMIKNKKGFVACHKIYGNVQFNV